MDTVERLSNSDLEDHRGSGTPVEGKAGRMEGRQEGDGLADRVPSGTVEGLGKKQTTVAHHTGRIHKY